MSGRGYKIVRRKVTQPIVAVITSKKENKSINENTHSRIKCKKKRFGIYTKSEEKLYEY